MINRISNALDSRYLRTWLMIFGIIVAVLCFEEVSDDVFSDPSEGDSEAQLFDRSLASFANSMRSPALNQIMTDFTALGSVSVLATLLIILISVLFSFRDIKGIIYLSVAGMGAALLPVTLKQLFNRPRPRDIDHLVSVIDLSFPSGHSFGAAAIYISLAYYSAQYARKGLQELFFYSLGAILICTVGISRIYLGVHYPTDVLAGLAGGIAWGLLISLVFELYSIRTTRTFKQ